MSKNKKIIILCVVLFISLTCLAGYVIGIKVKVDKWNDKVYPGIKVGQVDLSGKTIDEANKLLEENFKDSLISKVINIKGNKDIYTLKYEDLNVKLNISDITKKAINLGKDKGLFEKNNIIKDGINEELNIEFEYDNSIVDEFVKSICDAENVEPKNASISLNNGNISISESTNGITVNSEKLINDINNSIDNELTPEVNIEIPVEVKEASIKSEDLKKINGRLSGFSTSFNPSEVDRTKNLELATRFINGTVLMPGQTFSYNETVGERTAKRGFRNGAVFINNKVEEALGGGVCQVSTTLYRAVMSAGIKSVERHNHSLKTSYSDFGLDATVAWGYLDYKFKNTYDFPIYLEGYLTNNKVVFNVYGNKESLGGKTYDIVAEIVKRNEPSIKVVEDANLYVGKEEWETKPITGYIVNSYRVTYQNGAVISKEFIDKDTYAKVDGVKKVGVKKKEEAPQPTPKPELNPVPVPDVPPAIPNPPAQNLEKPEVPSNSEAQNNQTIEQ